MEFKTLLVIRCILITELLKPGGGCVLKLMICVTIIPILYMTGKDIEYLSQYLNPVNVVPEPALFGNIRYTIVETALGSEALREKFRLRKST